MLANLNHCWRASGTPTLLDNFSGAAIIGRYFDFQAASRYFLPVTIPFKVDQAPSRCCERTAYYCAAIAYQQWTFDNEQLHAVPD